MRHYSAGVPVYGQDIGMGFVDGVGGIRGYNFYFFFFQRSTLLLFLPCSPPQLVPISGLEQMLSNQPLVALHHLSHSIALGFFLKESQRLFRRPRQF